MQLRDRQGVRYALGSSAGVGGEATVYRIAGEPHLLAKLYRKPREEQEIKVRWMVTHPPVDPAAKLGHTSISWPLQALYGEDGFAGYLMPHIQDAVPLLTVFNPRLRLTTFQGFTQQHLYNTAFNLAAALGAIHARGYVVGDLNESNVLVARSTLVTVIDTDSFQVQSRIRGRPRLHFCEVGKPEYFPPEMQGADLKTTVRQPEHDRFALGVLVFQLLMDGSHPFRARWTGSGEKPSLPERIRQGWFAYRDTQIPGIEPIGSLERLHPLVADLMRRCFILGHSAPETRPPPEEWEQALALAIGELVPCRNGHFHSPALDACPECARGPLPVHRPVAAPQQPRGKSVPPPPPNFTPTAHRRPAKPTAPARSKPLPAAGSQPPAPRIRMQPVSPLLSIPSIFPPTFRARAQRWIRRQRPGTLIRNPGTWAAAGTLLGVVLSSQAAPQTAGSIMGLVGGLVSGALAGDVIEKKIGWEAFFGSFGVLTGLLVWAVFGGESGAGSWMLAGLIGGLAGIVVGRYGRFADLTLLWAASGALAGWTLGQWTAGLVSVDWLAAGISGGITGLLAGFSFALWKKYG